MIGRSVPLYGDLVYWVYYKICGSDRQERARPVKMFLIRLHLFFRIDHCMIMEKPMIKEDHVMGKRILPSVGRERCRWLSFLSASALLLALLFASKTAAASLQGTPFGEHGVLQVEGTGLVDEKGERYPLQGMSTHGIAWFPQYIDREAFRTLRDDWGTNCVRLAMYTEEYGGYCSGGDKEALKDLLDKGVTYASELGMYAVVDWHILSDGDPGLHQQEAVAFFDEMAERWKDRGNVLYEICNEPDSGTDWEKIRSYAQAVIVAIRRHDPDAVVIVGTPTWSQEIDKALEHPLEYDNVMYALHFYAATHTDWLRERCESCVQQGLPVFISEFGMCDASGNGANDFAQASAWMELIRKYGLSCCCWDLADKAESSSVLRPGCGKVSGWTQEDLSEAGRWIREQFRSGR